MKRTNAGVLCGLLLTAPAAMAQASPSGAYLGAAAGASRYAIDCSGAPCDRNDKGFKLFGGWRAAAQPWGVEAMVADFGRASVEGTPSASRYRKSALGVAATGTWHQREWFGALRLGVAATRIEHAPFGAAADSHTSASGWLGASVGIDLTPRIGLRLDWDGVKGKTRGNDNGDSGLLSLALVARF